MESMSHYSTLTHLLIHIAAEMAQYGDRNEMKMAFVTAPNENEDVLASFLKFYDTVAMNFHPSENLAKDVEVFCRSERFTENKTATSQPQQLRKT